MHFGDARLRAMIRRALVVQAREVSEVKLSVGNHMVEKRSASRWRRRAESIWDLNRKQSGIRLIS